MNKFVTPEAKRSSKSLNETTIEVSGIKIKFFLVDFFKAVCNFLLLSEKIRHF